MSTTKQRTALEDFISRQEFCDRFGISYRTAEMMAHKCRGPKVTHLGRKAVYHLDDISTWLEAERKKADARFKERKQA